MYTLHEHAFARQLANVRMMIPKGVTMTSSIVFMPEFFKGREVTMFFEKINYSASDYAVYVTKDCFRFLVAISDEVKVIRHNDVREDQEASRVSCLAERLAGNGFDIVSSEDWEAVSCNRRKVVGRRTGRDFEHCEERGVASKYSIELSGKA
jgi:hypothetical protein